MKLSNQTLRSTKYNQIYIKISSYILNKLNKRKYNKRPMELKYLYIAKATESSYKQVRTVMDKLIATKQIEKFYSATQKSGKLLRVCYYRAL